MAIDKTKTINKIHTFHTFTEAENAADELQKNDSEWTYKATQITEWFKNVVAVYDENDEFIAYW